MAKEPLPGSHVSISEAVVHVKQLEACFILLEHGIGLCL